MIIRVAAAWVLLWISFVVWDCFRLSYWFGCEVKNWQVRVLGVYLWRWVRDLQGSDPRGPYSVE